MIHELPDVGQVARSGSGSGLLPGRAKNGVAQDGHGTRAVSASVIGYLVVDSISESNFGPLIAYLVPGATVLLGLSPFSPLLQAWFASTPPTSPTLGGFLYLTVASLAAGMAVSALRWVVVDATHAWTGIRMPSLDFSKLGGNVQAFSLLIAIHYQHYLFYSNMFVATAVAYACYRVRLGWLGPWGWIDAGVAVMEVVFYVTSRDTLRKYYVRGSQVLRAEAAAASRG